MSKTQPLTIRNDNSERRSQTALRNNDANNDKDETMENRDSSIEVAQLKEWLAGNRLSLEAAGVAFIVGEYQGEGDEGLFTGTHALDVRGLQIDYSLPEEIADLIKAVAEQLADPDYEDGDGGGGEIRLSASTGAIVHEAYHFVTERSSHGEEIY